MNQDVYNKRVAEFQDGLRNFKEDIISGKIVVKNFPDFGRVCETTRYFKQEYDSIYSGIINSISRKTLEERLKEEMEFLKFLSILLKNLKHYHRVIHFVPEKEIQKEWGYLITILKEYNLLTLKAKMINAEMNRLYEKGLKSNPNSANTYNSILQTKEYNEMLKQKQEMDNLHFSQDTLDAMNKIEELGSATERIDDEISQNLKHVSQDINQKIEMLRNETISALDYFFDMEEAEIPIQQEENLVSAYEKNLQFVKEIVPSFESSQVVEDNIKEEQSNKMYVKEDTVIVDEEFFKTRSLTNQIDYLSLIVTNILSLNANGKLKGRKSTIQYMGEELRISKYYKGCLISYTGRLQKLKRQYEKEKEGYILNDMVDTTQQEMKYSDLYADFKYVKQDLFHLASQVVNRSAKDEVMAVATINGEPLYILKRHLEQFNKIFMNYKRLQRELQAYAIENNIEIIDSDLKLDSVEEAEKKIFNQLSDLYKENQTEEVLTNIKKLKRTLYNLNKGKRFALLANLKVMFRATHLGVDLYDFTSLVAEYPEKFLNSEEYEVEEKRKVFSEILSKANQYLEALKEKREVKQREKVGFKSIIANQVEKVHRCLNLLPKNLQNVLKIKKSRVAQNPKKLAFAVTTAAVGVATIAGFASLKDFKDIPLVETNERIETVIDQEVLAKNASATGTVLETDALTLEKIEEENKTSVQDAAIVNKISNDEVNLKTLHETHVENNKQENVQAEKQEKIQNQKESDEFDYAPVWDKIMTTNVGFDDTFVIKEGAEVYTQDVHAANEQNGVSPYFEESSIRDVAGIVYEYNGTVLTIYETEEDAEAKKTAIEANGAKQVGVLAMNENADEKGYEGFFNSEDIELSEGRGR